ncbi:hypothetical protein GF312_02660 [Candidatus Poribacteria bacterium]|nr:hypothetical protein [Candidatus Poribacteria bacterium]
MTKQHPKGFGIFILHEEGFALVVTVVIAFILVLFGGSLMTIAMQEIKQVSQEKKSKDAFYLARAGIADSIDTLRNEYYYISEEKYTRYYVSFESGSYSYSIEPLGKVHFIGSKYMTGTFHVEAVGYKDGKNRGLGSKIERDTFLRYSRFVSQGSLSYAANAEIFADVYVGNDLNLNGYPVTFHGDLEIGGRINNQHRGIYDGDIRGIGPGIDLHDSVNISYYRDLARGNIPNEGTGVYLSNTISLDLSLFDFSNNPPTYNGYQLPSDFNGVIFCESDIYVEGTLEGAKIGDETKGSLTFISNDDIIATDHVRTGNGNEDSRSTGSVTFNQRSGRRQTEYVNLNGIIDDDTTALKLRINGSRWSKMRMYIKEDGDVIAQTDLVRESGSPNEQTAIVNNVILDPDNHNYQAEIQFYSSDRGNNYANVEAYDGEPVNVGFVAKDMFYIDDNTPRELVIDAAILTRNRTWNALGNYYSHPDGFDSGNWELTINGPIITYNGGSAGPWSSYGKRNYNYDMDMIEYPPPAFPVPSDGWKIAYWYYMKEDEITL